MTHTAQRLSANAAGRWESHPIHIVSSRLHCSALESDAADPPQPQCERRHDEDSLRTFVGEEAFRLHVQFTHAHGVPRGEFTTFSTGGTPG